MLIKNITHSDMDGVGCSIIINKLFHDVMGFDELQISKTSYGDLFQNILNFVSYPQEETILIISDLNVETHILKKILDISHIKRLIYIDHHERSDDRKGLEGLKLLYSSKFTYKWQKGFSATKTAYEYAKSLGLEPTKEFDKLVNIIDVYDEWRKDDSKFNEGLSLNEIYWDGGFEEFYKQFYNGLIWTPEMKEFVKSRVNEQNEYFDEASDYIHEIEFGKHKVLISVNPKGKYNNLYTLRYDADLFVLFDYESKALKKFSLRSTNSYYDCNYITTEVSKCFKGSKGGGHKGASGISVPLEIEMEALIEEIIKVVEAI